jgi:MFS family permease
VVPRRWNPPRKLRGVSDADGLGFPDIVEIPKIRAATLGTFVIMLGFGILSPVLPKYARSFGVGYDGVWILVAAFSLTRFGLRPDYRHPHAPDRRGARPVSDRRERRRRTS